LPRATRPAVGSLAPEIGEIIRSNPSPVIAFIRRGHTSAE
jgi:hypothetical protein